MSIEIVLVDDHQVMLEGLRALLENETEMAVVGEATDGRAALELIEQTQPDIVILDVAMPELNGIDTARLIASKHPKVKMLALSMHPNQRYVAEMLQAGAAGYLLKSCAFDEMVQAIREVMGGGTYLSSQVARTVVSDYEDKVQAEPEGDLSVLSRRERQVLQLVAEGCSTKQIAKRLDVSVKTVDTHRQHIMNKLAIHSVAELTKYAIREGMTPLEC